MLLVGCVSQPHYADYVGSDKVDALHDLNNMKTSNTVKIICNWLLWGWTLGWIPSIVDTISYIAYMNDFDSVQRRIENTPNGAKVGQ